MKKDNDNILHINEYHVRCPICNSNILKSFLGSNVEVPCPKCHVIFNILHDTKGMLVMEPKNYTYKA